MSTSAQKPRKALSIDDVEALSMFEFELASLRTSVQLTEVLTESVKLESIKHPVLRFAIDKAPAAVAENLLLRAAELLVIMDRVRAAQGLARIFPQTGGRRTPKDPVFRLAWDLRQERVAHRVKMRGTQAPGPSWGIVREAYGTVWKFLDDVLDQLEARLGEIRAGGMPLRIPRNAARKLYVRFTAEDVARLVTAADELPAAREAREET